LLWAERPVRFEHVIPIRFPLFTAGLIGAALAFALDDTNPYPTAVQLAAWGFGGVTCQAPRPSQ